MRKQRWCKLVLLAALAAWSGIALASPAISVEQIGTLRVQQSGDHGRAVILIPGLESGPWVWQQSIADLEKSHVVYAVTLAGFDGMPSPARMTGLGDQASASLLQLIVLHHLDKPVLVGHSLGGALALRFAGEHPALISGAVSVDAPPIIPGMDQPDAAQRQQLREVFEKIGPATALEDMQQSVIDPALAARYAPLVARSDPAAVRAYLAEGLDADLRPLMKHADVPILAIAAYYRPDFERDAAMSKQPVMSEADNVAYFQGLFADTPQAKVVSISPSRHFVMLDQPEKFRLALDAFLQSLPAESERAG